MPRVKGLRIPSLNSKYHHLPFSYWLKLVTKCKNFVISSKEVPYLACTYTLYRYQYQYLPGTVPTGTYRYQYLPRYLYQYQYE